jgi:hypothetical protein
VLDAAAGEMTAHVSPMLGRLEPLDATACRIVGSTSSPWWYAAQLAALPVPYHVVSGDEVRHCVRAIGQRMLDATAEPTESAP